MEKGGTKHSGTEAIRLIDEQIRVLMIALRGSRELPAPETGGVELARSHEPALVLGAEASEPPARATIERVLVTNALLAAGIFLADHDIANSRTPEIQFLNRVCDAIRHDNVLTLPPNETLPKTHLGDLSINASDDGRPLFDEEGKTNGLMRVGDGVALLQRVADHLRGMKHLYSAGDAG